MRITHIRRSLQTINPTKNSTSAIGFCFQNWNWRVIFTVVWRNNLFRTLEIVFFKTEDRLQQAKQNKHQFCSGRECDMLTDSASAEEVYNTCMYIINIYITQWGILYMYNSLYVCFHRHSFRLHMLTHWHGRAVVNASIPNVCAYGVCVYCVFNRLRWFVSFYQELVCSRHSTGNKVRMCSEQNDIDANSAFCTWLCFCYRLINILIVHLILLCIFVCTISFHSVWMMRNVIYIII